MLVGRLTHRSRASGQLPAPRLIWAEPAWLYKIGVFIDRSCAYINFNGGTSRGLLSSITHTFPSLQFITLPLSRMATSAGVLFIIGGGPRIGHSVAKRFLQQGYKVAVGRRNTQDTASSPELAGALPVSLDVTKPRSIEAAFDEVESKLGIPNVVVYNGRKLSRGTRSDALRAS